MLISLPVGYLYCETADLEGVSRGRLGMACTDCKCGAKLDSGPEQPFQEGIYIS